jgi:hypothetical protein
MCHKRTNFVAQPNQNPAPMTLGNMRANGVRTLAVLPRLLAAQIERAPQPKSV